MTLALWILWVSAALAVACVFSALLCKCQSRIETGANYWRAQLCMGFSIMSIVAFALIAAIAAVYLYVAPALARMS
jgi:hypothetical protein